MIGELALTTTAWRITPELGTAAGGEGVGFRAGARVWFKCLRVPRNLDTQKRSFFPISPLAESG